MADSEKKIAAAYVAWGTFKNALDQLSQGVPPNRIDRSVFPGMAWAIQNQLFTGLKFLGLIDEHSRPTPEMEALALGEDEADRKLALGELLRKRYSHLFALDLKKTTPNELAQKMGEAYGVSGDTKEKAVRFFVSAAEYTGIELSPLFEAGKKTTGGVQRPANKRKARTRVNSIQEPEVEAEPAPTGTSRTVALKSGGTLTLSASLDLFALMPSDRKFVFGIIDMLDGYEKGDNEPLVAVIEEAPTGFRSAPRLRQRPVTEAITDDDVPF